MRLVIAQFLGAGETDYGLPAAHFGALPISEILGLHARGDLADQWKIHVPDSPNPEVIDLGAERGRRSTEVYFHIARIRAPTSMRICCALRSDAAADTSGQVAVSKNCSNVAGMKRVLAA